MKINIDERFVCNKCKKTINQAYGNDREDCLRIVKDWGYFSEKDLQTHEIVLCEKCYDEFVDWLELPVKITQREEVM